MLNLKSEKRVEPTLMDDEEIFELSDVEMETLRRAATERLLPYDVERRRYSRAELSRYGMVREAYTTQELRRLGFGPEEVSCFDERARVAQDLLKVDTPFGSGIKKWQLPIDMMPMPMEQTVFPPATSVRPHVHPANSQEAPGGGLRIITKGKIFYKGREYGPGDWFFVPNGVPYSFTTDPAGPTVVMYRYAFFGSQQENRFSHPSGVHGNP